MSFWSTCHFWHTKFGTIILMILIDAFVFIIKFTFMTRVDGYTKYDYDTSSSSQRDVFLDTQPEQGLKPISNAQPHCKFFLLKRMMIRIDSYGTSCCIEKYHCWQRIYFLTLCLCKYSKWMQLQTTESKIDSNCLHRKSQWQCGGIKICFVV